MAYLAHMDIRTSQRRERAACFQKIAEDAKTRPEIRAWFAHQANMLRMKGKFAEPHDTRAIRH